MSGARILVVDDEPEILRALRAILTARGFVADLAPSAAEGLAQIHRHRPDLVLLDLALPDLDGLELCRVIRQELELDLPIIVLSATEDEAKKVQAFDLGADDYVTKPFGVAELLARIRVALRHASAARPSGQAMLEHGPLRIDLERHEVTMAGQPVHLTPKKYEVLRYLLANVGKLVTHRRCYGPSGGEYEDARPYLHVLVGQLRRKIEPDPAHPRYLLTEAGVGYRLADA